MLKSKSLIAVAIAAALALPLAATAAGMEKQSGGMSSEKQASGIPTMTQLDTNKDGFVSKEEAKKSATISKRFNELDKDKDGKLSAAELSAAEAPAAGGAAKEPGGTGTMGSGGTSPKKSY